ncbi:MAG: DUF3098 domain-containing protein [Bacteroidota bacterium]
MSKKDKKQSPSGPQGFAIPRENYLYIIIGVVILAAGFLLMAGGASPDPKQFSEEIFSTRRLTVAPIVLLIGFGVVFYAIMRKPKSKLPAGTPGAAEKE